VTFYGTALEGVDSVHFAWALQDYDLVHYRPHFPGYPVYLAVGWLMWHLVGDPARALTLTSCLFGSLTLFPLYLLARRFYDDTVATLTAVLFIVNPLFWLEASKAYSDSSGLFFLITAAALGYQALADHRDSQQQADEASRITLRPLYWGSVVFGVLFGVRLAYLPFVWTWGLLVYQLCRLRKDRLPLLTAFNGMILGIGVWLVPFVLKVGVADIIRAAQMNTVGTVYQYGDTLVTSHDYFGRAIQLYIWNVLVNGLGFWWPDTSPLRLLPTALGLVALVTFWRSRRRTPDRGVFLAWLVPYGLWLYIAQNPNNPRHVLPLLPPLLIGIAAGVLTNQRWLVPWTKTSAWCGPAAGLLLSGALAGVTLPLVYQYHTVLPARVQLVQYVTEHYDPQTTKVYCWWSRRFFQYYAPAWRHSLPRIRRPLTIHLTSAQTILVTSDFFAGGFSPQDFRLTPVKVFSRNRYLHPWLHSLTLYRLEADYTQRAEAR
jgi:hypothetical protein